MTTRTRTLTSSESSITKLLTRKETEGLTTLPQRFYDMTKNKKIDFDVQIMLLKKKMLEEIQNLMEENGIEELDLTQDTDDSPRESNGYIIRQIYGEVEQAKVRQIALDKHFLVYVGENDACRDEEWRNLVDDIVGDNLDALYEDVFKKVEELKGDKFK